MFWPLCLWGSQRCLWHIPDTGNSLQSSQSQCQTLLGSAGMDRMSVLRVKKKEEIFNLKTSVMAFSYLLFTKVRWHFLDSRGRGRSQSYQFFCCGRWLLQRLLLFLIFPGLWLFSLQRGLLWTNRRAAAERKFDSEDVERRSRGWCRQGKQNKMKNVKKRNNTFSSCPDSSRAQSWSSFSWPPSSQHISSFLGGWSGLFSPVG